MRTDQITLVEIHIGIKVHKQPIFHHLLRILLPVWGEKWLSDEREEDMSGVTMSRGLQMAAMTTWWQTAWLQRCFLSGTEQKQPIIG